MRPFICCASFTVCLLLVASCGSNRPSETLDPVSANSEQRALKTRLEQVLFDQIVKPSVALPLDEAPLRELRMNCLERIESSVDTTLLRADQQRLLDALRWARGEAINQNQAITGQIPVGIEPWLYARLQRLQRTQFPPEVDTQERSHLIGAGDSDIQQFFDLIQEALLTQAQLNPLTLDYDRLDALLVKPTLLSTDRAFFYQDNDSSIRINRSILPDLAWADAEIIALTQGLPGHHFLKSQSRSPNWFPAQSIINRSAMSLFLLERLAEEPFYQTRYSPGARLSHLTLTTLVYLTAVDPELTLDFFDQSLGAHSVSQPRLKHAFDRALRNRQTLIAEAEALRSIERTVFIKGVPMKPTKLNDDARARLDTLIDSLNLPLKALKL